MQPSATNGPLGIDQKEPRLVVKPWLPIRNDTAAAPVDIHPLRAANYFRICTADQNCEPLLPEFQDYAAQHEWLAVWSDLRDDARAGFFTPDTWVGLRSLTKPAWRSPVAGRCA